MKVKKVLNSSVVLAEDSRAKNYILFGKGIGYGRKAGDSIDEHQIDRTFMPVESDKGRELLELVNTISPEFFKIVQLIIERAEGKLNARLNPNIYFTLMDHLNFAIERHKKGITILNHVFWEIKNYYPEEFEIGLYGLKLVDDMLSIRLPEEEAANIAFHIFNARADDMQSRDGMKYAKMVGAIVDLTRYALNINIDTDSIYFQRFVTHIKFFVNRFLQNKMLENDNQLYLQISNLYPDSMKGALKVKEYMRKLHNKEIPEEELGYLAIHMNTLVAESKKSKTQVNNSEFNDFNA